MTTSLIQLPRCLFYYPPPLVAWLPPGVPSTTHLPWLPGYLQVSLLLPTSPGCLATSRCPFYYGFLAISRCLFYYPPPLVSWLSPGVSSTTHLTWLPGYLQVSLLLPTSPGCLATSRCPFYYGFLAISRCLFYYPPPLVSWLSPGVSPHLVALLSPGVSSGTPQLLHSLLAHSNTLPHDDRLFRTQADPLTPWKWRVHTGDSVKPEDNLLDSII